MTELTRLVASSVSNASTSHQLGIQLPASTQSLVFCDEAPSLTDVESIVDAMRQISRL